MLKNHPFAVAAHFEFSLVLSYAIPKEELQQIIPSFLSLDTFNDTFAFFTLAIVKVNKLRPKALPAMFGQDFHLIGHRIFVQYVNEKGKRLRGLYILKSQTDKNQMKLLGNAMTHYKYEKTDIRTAWHKESLCIEAGSTLRLQAKLGNEDSPLPLTSVFTSWKEARRFAGPLPFTFSALNEEDQILIVEGQRSNWIPKPIEIEDLELNLPNYSFMRHAKLSNAFIVENIPYAWKKGRIELWKK